MSGTSETTKRDGRTGVLVGSFICGALTGAAVALLFAPVRGREARERLGGKIQEGRDQASRVLERGKAAVEQTRTHLHDQARHVSQAVTEARAALTDVRARGEDAVAAIRREAAAAIADAKTAYQDVRTEVTGRPKE